MAAQTIAILGGTGQTGREVVQCLLANSNIRLHIYVRSATKLKSLLPTIDSAKAVTIFEGKIQDTDLMTRCLSGVDTVIFTLGYNDNRPDVGIIENGAASVLAALGVLRNKGQLSHPMRLLLLSSCTWNPVLAGQRPRVIDWLIRHAFYHPYCDLLQGHSLFLGSPSLVKLTLVQPPAIMEDEPSGYELSTDSIRLACTYQDLAAGFVAVATSKDYEGVDAIGVSSKAGDKFVKYLPTIFYKISKGLMAMYIPGFWYLHDLVVGSS